MADNNPLSKYFRKPGIHQALPTKGQFFDEGEVEFSANNEVAVFPMTAADEIVVKNPDMLLNGEALEKLFQSCVPAIKNPKKISVPDMDVLLLAIKLSSGGDDLAVATECPQCETKVEPVVSIRELLATVKQMDHTSEVRLNDEVVVQVKPHDFESKTILDMAAFEERQLVRYLLGNEEMDDRERGRRFNESFDKFASLNLQLVSRCVISVTTPEGIVTDQAFISELIQNLDKNSVAKITDKIKELGDNGMQREIKITCPNDECKHQWDSSLVFDPSHFFD